MLLIKLIIKELINIESKDKEEEEWKKAKFINEKLFNTLSSMYQTSTNKALKSLEYSKKTKN